MITAMAKWITKHPTLVIIIAFLLVIPSAIGFFTTQVNYDILSYLPESLDSVQGINILDDEFNEASMSIIVMDSMSWNEMSELEEKISALENVRTAMWLGTISQSKIPISMLPESISSMLYNKDGNSTLMIVQYKAEGASMETLNTIKEIKGMLTKQCLMSGTSAMTYDMKELIENEAPLYIAIAIALALLALSLTMESFILPFVLLTALGLAVIYNMGTNFMFGQISFITQSVAAILQLGVTMDYSVFLMDRYSEEKKTHEYRTDAMTKAIASTFSSLAGSSLTTIFGFLALCFMSLTLGLDIGLVMAKGVLFGIITVVVVLPALILLLERFIEKTRHRSLVPSFGGINKITIKFRKAFAILFVILLVPSWYAQNNVKKYYNMMQAMPDTMESINALDVLKDDFNMASSYFAIVDDNLPANTKLQMLDDLGKVDGVSGVLGLNSVLGTAFSKDILPDKIKSIFSVNGKQMIMINSSYTPASDEGNAQVDTLDALLKSYDPNAKLTGEGPMYKDLVEVTNRDFIVTNAISIIAIFILIAIIFKSVSIPFILVLSIELAIWINMAISFIAGDEICFITPTIISCVQLGATVDYAILLTTRFKEELTKGNEKKAAMKTAADSAHKSIFQSAIVFFAATIGVYIVCDIDIVRSICAMLARGAIISALVIMLLLTPLLVVCEDLINKTTKDWRKAKEIISEEQLEAFTAKVRKKRMKKIIAKQIAKPVPAELVTDKLTPEKGEEIKELMKEMAEKEEQEKKDENGDETT